MGAAALLLLLPLVRTRVWMNAWIDGGMGLNQSAPPFLTRVRVTSLLLLLRSPSLLPTSVGAYQRRKRRRGGGCFTEGGMEGEK